MKIIAFLNPTSGSVPQDGAALLTNAVNELGYDSTVKEAVPSTMKQAFKDAISQNPDLMIVWSGDGTLACALDIAGPSEVPILALPGGTLNLLHQNIHGEALDWQTCLKRALKNGTQKHIPAGQVGANRFYVAAMIGALTKLAEPRELLRDGQPIKALQEFSRSASLELKTALRVKTSNLTAPLKATALAILPAPKTEKYLEIAAIDPDTTIDLVITGLSAMKSGWRKARGVNRRQAKSATVRHLENTDLNVTLDGEPTRFPSGVKFTRIERAALVLSVGQS